eukprot:TRINITY_DN49391_c0_g1_i1.p1 TRINITY_DN49391_c0_g1~~TRINITY_DN49391_c0_g1_i1.p1  ORF type:complete len:794 (+),score=59.18 TRINITY_DN49391_c0_g1_i1:110-2491(+)
MRHGFKILVLPYSASSFFQTNHLYANEAWDSIDHQRPSKCTKYEADDPDVVLSAERYPWSRGVRRGGGADVLYGTAYAQRMIWEHQHPPDCSQAKYLMMLHWPVGIGALLHFLAHALGLAMHLGRLLVLAVEDYSGRKGSMGMPWYDAEVCPGATSWECWFQPLSSCPYVGGDTEVVQIEHLDIFRGETNFTRHYVPEVFQELLRECSPVKRSGFFYWWHVQAITYIVRFNWNTRILLDRLRGQLLHSRKFDFQTPRRWSHAAVSLPAGTIAMHVRHGDKGIEMPLLPAGRYVRRALRLAAGDQGQQVLGPEFGGGGQTFQYPNHRFAVRSLFISTEDADSVEEAGRLAEGDFKFLHRGLCHEAGNGSIKSRLSVGGDGIATAVGRMVTRSQCAKLCRATHGCAHFSYSPVVHDCALYVSAGGCARGDSSGDRHLAYRSYGMGSSVVANSRFAYLCAAGENRECVCHGTVFYGRKNLAVGAAAVTTLDELKAADHRQHQAWGMVQCNAQSLGSLSLPKGTRTWCFCEPAEELSYVYIHDGACAKGFLEGSGTQQPSVGACAAHCRAVDDCGHFSYDQVSMNCRLSSLAGGCPETTGINRFPGYRSFRMVSEFDYVLFHADGRCTRDGLLQDQTTKQKNFHSCAATCQTTFQCAFFAYSVSSGVCALYLEKAGCVKDTDSAGFRSYHLISQEPWQVFFTRENRTNVPVSEMRRQRGNGQATLQSFLNLELALEAEGWVCTLFSNWCQLIDELRMTVGAKASAPYLNLVHGSWRSSRRRGYGCPFQQPDCYTHWR